MFFFSWASQYTSPKCESVCFNIVSYIIISDGSRNLERGVQRYQVARRRATPTLGHVTTLSAHGNFIKVSSAQVVWGWLASIPGRRESGLVFTVCACAAITQNLGDLYIVVNWPAYLLRIRSRVIVIALQLRGAAALVSCDSFDLPRVTSPLLSLMLCQVWEARTGHKGQAARNGSCGPYTGYGKSICFQTLPFLFDTKLGRMNSSSSQRSVILVISPLAFLRVNQVSQLRSVGVSAAILSLQIYLRGFRLLTQSQVLPYLQLSQARSTTAFTTQGLYTHSVVYLWACRILIDNLRTVLLIIYYYFHACANSKYQVAFPRRPGIEAIS